MAVSHTRKLINTNENISLVCADRIYLWCKPRITIELMEWKKKQREIRYVIIIDDITEELNLSLISIGKSIRSF